MSTLTKGAVRSDMKYVRELMRQIEAAMKNEDWREVAVISNEAGACFFTIVDKTGFDI